MGLDAEGIRLSQWVGNQNAKRCLLIWGHGLLYSYTLAKMWGINANMLLCWLSEAWGKSKLAPNDEEMVEIPCP